MSEKSFFEKTGPYKLKILSDHINGKLSSINSSDILIEDISSLKNANDSEITFFSNLSLKKELKHSSAGACVISELNVDLAPRDMPLILCDDPYMGFALISQKFYPKELKTDYLTGQKNNISNDIPDNITLGRDVIIEFGAVVGKNAVIGDNTFIASNSVIGANVKIGEDCYIGSNVSITHSYIGNNVKIHNGTSIGQDGFGFAMSSSGHQKIPQLGLVEIHNDVEIGANCTIDRGTAESTIIGEGTKLDNLVHIAHNCIIGKNCILTGMVGLAGSTVLEDFVVMGAKSGAVGHLTIGKGSQIAAKTGVTKDLPPGQKWAGWPVKRMDVWKKELIALKKIIKK
ncbi:MAG: UDP-3-O-(3-hydroxymyristoyl)glucosamine N-acyltransferase [Rhodobiaceae bacterium]|nr:UDP-3-O-(3-hydroxymyristoyl)glucosamine N-acyltransferase [Rhodobiaceae bacterium]